jgi:hypothetical protein
VSRTTAITLCFLSLVVAATVLALSYWRHEYPSEPDEGPDVCDKCWQTVQLQWDCGARVGGGGCSDSRPKWENPEMCNEARQTELERCTKLCESHGEEPSKEKP